MTVDVRLVPDDLQAGAAPRRPGRTGGHAQVDAAGVVLRRPRLRAVRGHHPHARVLPVPHRARRCCGGRPARSPRRRRRVGAGRAGVGHVREDPAAARRHGGRARAGPRRGYVARSTWPRPRCAPRPRRSPTTWASASTRVVGDFHEHLDDIPDLDGPGWWRSWAAPSATSRRPSGAASCRAGGPARPVGPVPARDRPGQARRAASSPPTTTPPG